MSDQALLIIDVQVGMFPESDPVHEGKKLLVTLQKLIEKARQQGIQIVYIQHNEGPGAPLESGTSGWEIHPSIKPKEEDLIIQKHTPDSFHKTPLHSELDKRGIKKLVIAGIQTEICVDTTCRRAFSLGYQVILCKDGHGTWNTDQLSASQIIDHHNETLRWFAAVKESKECFL